VRRERRLRQVVGRLRGCLDGLPMLERRVLVLRAGVGPGGPRSRTRVARALDLTPRRVARLERRGLRHLRGSGRDGCGIGTSADDPVTVVRVSAPAATGFGRALVAAATFAAGEPDRIEVKAEQESSKSSGGADTKPELSSPEANAKELGPPVAAAKLPEDPGFPLVLGLVLLAVVVIGFVLEARRSVPPR
jgi:Sigma-70, region 4